MMQYWLMNSSYSHITGGEEPQQFRILWTFNLTSERIPKDDFVSELVVDFSVREFSGGINRTETVTITSAI